MIIDYTQLANKIKVLEFYKEQHVFWREIRPMSFEETFELDKEREFWQDLKNNLYSEIISDIKTNQP